MEKVLLFDDLDHDQPAVETMPFAIDGENYLIDVSADNAKAFREAVEPFRRVARRLGKHKAGAARSARKAPRPAEPKARTVPAEWYKSVRGESAEVAAKKRTYRQRVRAWAAEQPGQATGTRGVISRETYEAYEKWAADNDVATGPDSVGL